MTFREWARLIRIAGFGEPEIPAQREVPSASTNGVA
jgi:hypothetical protein